MNVLFYSILKLVFIYNWKELKIFHIIIKNTSKPSIKIWENKSGLNNYIHFVCFLITIVNIFISESFYRLVFGVTST